MDSVKLTVALAVVVLALPLLWLAGEQHRKNCLASNRVACSVLPWETGHYVHAPTATQSARPPRNRFLAP